MADILFDHLMQRICWRRWINKTCILLGANYFPQQPYWFTNHQFGSANSPSQIVHTCSGTVFFSSSFSPSPQKACVPSTLFIWRYKCSVWSNCCWSENNLFFFLDVLVLWHFPHFGIEPSRHIDFLAKVGWTLHHSLNIYWVPNLWSASHYGVVTVSLDLY